MSVSENKILWPGWETVRLIGKGSFGAVYEIQRDVFGNIEKAALKMISIPQNESDIEELFSEGYDEESITRRFEGFLQDIVREYSMMAEMKGCSNIVYCDDVKYIQHDDGIGWDIFIKMELLTPLTKALPKTISDEQVIRIGEDICSALAYCEKRNVLHRDIKPQNIFVAPDGTCKLGDFGIAKVAEHTTSGTKAGTFKYMAPEVYNNQPYGTKADIYSLGLVLYWLLNERRLPFMPMPPEIPTSTDEENAKKRRMNGERIPAPAHGSGELKRIVLKACAFDPSKRYQSAEEMLAELENIGGPKKRENSVREEEYTVRVWNEEEKEPEENKTVGVWQNQRKKVDQTNCGGAQMNQENQSNPIYPDGAWANQENDQSRNMKAREWTDREPVMGGETEKKRFSGQRIVIGLSVLLLLAVIIFAVSVYKLSLMGRANAGGPAQTPAPESGSVSTPAPTPTPTPTPGDENTEYYSDGRKKTSYEYVNGTRVDWVYCYDNNNVFMYKKHCIQEIDLTWSKDCIPDSKTLYQNLSTAVYDCVGFTFDFKIPIVTSGTGRGDRILKVLTTDGEWVDIQTFEYPDYKLVSLCVELDSPLSIKAIGTLKVASSSKNAYTATGALRDVWVADYNY